MELRNSYCFLNIELKKRQEKTAETKTTVRSLVEAFADKLLKLWKHGLQQRKVSLTKHSFILVAKSKSTTKKKRNQGLVSWCSHHLQCWHGRRFESQPFHFRFSSLLMAWKKSSETWSKFGAPVTRNPEKQAKCYGSIVNPCFAISWIPYGSWFLLALLHFPFSSLLVTWECSDGWTKPGDPAPWKKLLSLDQLSSHHWSHLERKPADIRSFCLSFPL